MTEEQATSWARVMREAGIGVRVQDYYSHAANGFRLGVEAMDRDGVWHFLRTTTKCSNFRNRFIDGKVPQS